MSSISAVSRFHEGLLNALGRNLGRNRRKLRGVFSERNKSCACSMVAERGDWSASSFPNTPARSGTDTFLTHARGQSMVIACVVDDQADRRALGYRTRRISGGSLSTRVPLYFF
jgi:hypothetical protein